MEPVLELITSYENRITAVEGLITLAYEGTVASGRSFDILDEERKKLKAGLQETLARNCSLRRKDFNQMLERLLVDSDKNREVIEEERGRIRERVREYLGEQKEMADQLRKRLLDLTGDKQNKGCLNTIISNIKATYEDRGQHLFAALREFQLYLEAYLKEQKEINHKLQGLMERGECLKPEDLGTLESAGTERGKKADRELLRGEVGRLLSGFRHHELKIGRH